MSQPPPKLPNLHPHGQTPSSPANPKSSAHAKKPCCEAERTTNVCPKSRPPGFSKIGRGVRDLLYTNFDANRFNVSTKTKLVDGLTLNTAAGYIITNKQFEGKLNLNSRLDTWALKTQFPEWLAHRVKVNEHWDTSNLSTEKFIFNDVFLEGLKLTAASSLRSANPSAQFQAKYTNEFIRASNKLTLDFSPDKNNRFDMQCVLRYKGWLLGHQGAVDFKKMIMTENNFALGWKRCRYDFALQLNRFKELSGHLGVKCSDRVETGIIVSSEPAVSWRPEIAVGLKWQWNENASLRVRAKRNEIAIGHSFRISKSLTLHISRSAKVDRTGIYGESLGAALAYENM